MVQERDSCVHAHNVSSSTRLCQAVPGSARLKWALPDSAWLYHAVPDSDFMDAVLCLGPVLRSLNFFPSPGKERAHCGRHPLSARPCSACPATNCPPYHPVSSCHVAPCGSDLIPPPRALLRGILCVRRLGLKRTHPYQRCAPQSS